MDLPPSKPGGSQGGEPGRGGGDPQGPGEAGAGAVCFECFLVVENHGKSNFNPFFMCLTEKENLGGEMKIVEFAENIGGQVLSLPNEVIKRRRRNPI